jgi:hypothetical protein
MVSIVVDKFSDHARLDHARQKPVTAARNNSGSALGNQKIWFWRLVVLLSKKACEPRTGE